MKMQIFVMNTAEGKTVTVDVEPGDTVKTVKERLQVKIGIPIHLQRLVFNSRPLIDGNPLLHYNIQKESNLRLNVQTWNRTEDPETLPGHSVDWSKVAFTAKGKVDKEIEEKKRKYESLLKSKSDSVAKSKKVEADIMHSLAETEKAGRMVLLIDKEIRTDEKKIKTKEEKIEKLRDNLKKENEALQAKKKFKMDTNNQIHVKTMNRMHKREELRRLRVKIEKLKEEMEETFLVASDRLEKEKDDLVKANVVKDQAIREFLNGSILEKESLLECPVCLQTASPPIFKCTKEHLVCGKCFPKMNSKCPTCRSGFASSDNVFRLAEENWRELQKMKEKVKEFC